MVRRFFSLPLVALFLACASVASAQDDVRGADAPAHISLVEGTAVLERDGRTDDAPANMPLLAGDRVRTRAGRVEILFGDGSTLHLDHNTSIDLQSDDLVRLLDGRIRLSIPVHARDVSYRIDGPHAWAQISQAGDYRAAIIQNAGATELEFAVLRGAAELMNEDGRTPLRAGERAFARADTAPSYAYVFNSMSSDPFDRWSEGRRSERLGLSAQYLPQEVRPYASTLDRYGAWQYETSYGYVWYPRVDYSWRPYYHGRWSTLRPYGWTWIGIDPWAWPTHHYGRWGFNRGVWFWIPGRSWSPAWVSWAYAPGYVSWCPLGYNNRPVVQIFNVNVHQGYDPWRAWTVLPQRSFGTGFVHRNVINSLAIDARTRSSFAQRDSAPAVTGYAVPRGTAPLPIRTAGTNPTRRTSPALLSNRPEPTSRGDRGAVSGERPERIRDAAPVAQPTRPMIRSERTREPGARPSAPERYAPGSSYDPSVRRATPRSEYGRQSPEPSPQPQRPERPSYTAPDTNDRRQPGLDRPSYGTPNGYERRPAPDRPSYGTPGGYDRRQPPPDRPAYGAPGGYERRQPAMERPSPPPPPSAQPARPDRSAPPPSGAPPAGGRGRPSGGEAPSRGTAVRRPGGGS